MKEEPLNIETSNLRVFIRTFLVLILFTISMLNVRSLLSPYSLISTLNMISEANNHLVESIGLWQDLAIFGIVLVLTLSLWATLVTFISQSPYLTLGTQTQRDLYWLLIVLLSCTLIVSVNSYYFPTSLTSYLRQTPFSSPVMIVGQIIVLLFLYIASALSIKNSFSRCATLLLPILILVAAITPSNTSKQVELASKPNIFIIGIDALRPDHLAFLGANPALAPNINRRLTDMSVYEKTYSPMSRTYAAWMSILTGKYPINNGARFNLTPPEVVNTSLPLINHLNSEGYKTIYAIDERRFNQIDMSYGFDETVGPKIGAADSIITSLADLPYINIALLHPLSKHILPYLYNNRAYGKAYNLIRFNQDVLTSLSDTQANFLAVHFCQLHWPYSSKEFVAQAPQEWDGNYNHFMYKQMMRNVDKQVEHLLSGLEERGMLENAIVYLVSDHGESFNITDTSEPSAVTSELPSMKAWGHGTNIIDDKQSHVLLARARYIKGSIVNEKAVFKGVYSLVDILPSLADSLSITNRKLKDLDGIVLPVTKDDVRAHRFVYLESSIPVKSINTSFIDKKKLLSETEAYYEVRDDGKPYMRIDEYDDFIAKKQRAIRSEDWQLTLLPDYDGPVLLNVKLNQLTIPNDSTAVDWQTMRDKLCKQFKADLEFYQRENCAVNLSAIVNKSNRNED